MLRTAAEIQAQLSNIKEEIRKKRIAIEYTCCSQCQTELRFQYEIARDFRTGEGRVIESGSCPTCLGKIEPRAYRMH